jgi:hypothetical protein
MVLAIADNLRPTIVLYLLSRQSALDVEGAAMDGDFKPAH